MLVVAAFFGGRASLMSRLGEEQLRAKEQAERSKVLEQKLDDISKLAMAEKAAFRAYVTRTETAADVSR